MSRKRFEWQVIHDELEARLASIAATVDDDPARAERLLRDRSTALAASRQNKGARAPLPRMLVFRLGSERYALALECAREVAELANVAILPGVAASVVGLVNWREEFVVVFDAASVLGVPLPDEQTRRRVIVLRGEEPRVALAVDAVEDVVAIDPAALQPPGQLGSRHADLLKGGTDDAILVVAEDALRARLAGELKAA
jgi:purine-binding chemotaxis protein CheW